MNLGKATASNFFFSLEYAKDLRIIVGVVAIEAHGGLASFDGAHVGFGFGFSVRSPLP